MWNIFVLRIILIIRSGVWWFTQCLSQDHVKMLDAVYLSPSYGKKSHDDVITLLVLSDGKAPVTCGFFTQRRSNAELWCTLFHQQSICLNTHAVSMQSFEVYRILPNLHRVIWKRCLQTTIPYSWWIYIYIMKIFWSFNYKSYTLFTPSRYTTRKMF